MAASACGPAHRHHVLGQVILVHNSAHTLTTEDITVWPTTPNANSTSLKGPAINAITLLHAPDMTLAMENASGFEQGRHFVPF